MIPLKRLAQALPPYQTLCGHHCRTTLSPLLQYHPRSRPALPVALYGFYPCFLAIRSNFSTDARDLVHNKAVHEIIYAVDQTSDLPNRVSRLFPTWRISASKKGITCQFTFKSFAKAWKFMTLVAEECKAKKHHPSWSNLYNQVTVEWTTHKPEGLSIKDVEMAEFCNRVADDIGLKE